MYRYIKCSEEAFEPIGTIDAVVVTTDIENFVSGIYASTNLDRVRFTDYTDEQLSEIDDDYIKELDYKDSDDLALLADIFLLHANNRYRLSAAQKRAVEDLLYEVDNTSTDYFVNLKELVLKLHGITQYKIQYASEGRNDDSAKNSELLDVLVPEPDQVLYVLKSLEESDFDGRVVAGNPATLGSYIYIAKPNRALEIKSGNGTTKVKRFDLFIRVVDGYKDDSNIIVLSFHTSE